MIVKKGEKVKVVSIDQKDWDKDTGQIRWYKVKKQNKTYYLSGAYVESSRKLALKKYDQAISYSTYWDDYYKDGYSKDAYTSQIDYKPIKKKYIKKIRCLNMLSPSMYQWTISSTIKNTSKS